MHLSDIKDDIKAPLVSGCSSPYLMYVLHSGLFGFILWLLQHHSWCYPTEHSLKKNLPAHYSIKAMPLLWRYVNVFSGTLRDSLLHSGVFRSAHIITLALSRDPWKICCQTSKTQWFHWIMWWRKEIICWPIRYRRINTDFRDPSDHVRMTCLLPLWPFHQQPSMNVSCVFVCVQPSHPSRAVHLYLSETSIEIDSSDGMISDPSTPDSSSEEEEGPSSDDDEDEDSDWETYVAM